MLKSKRAISALVATVLLILITVVAVGIIWGAITPMMNRAMEMGQACLSARLTINTESGYTCYNSTAFPSHGEVQVMISRGSEEFELAGMHLILSGVGQSKTFIVRNNTNSSYIRMIEDSDYGQLLELPNVNEERTYVINASGFTNVEEVKVAPIVHVGNTEKVCQVSSRVAIASCG